MTLRVSNDSREWAPFVYHTVVMEIVSTLTALIDLLDQWKKNLVSISYSNFSWKLSWVSNKNNAKWKCISIQKKKKLNGYDNPSYVTTKIVKDVFHKAFPMWREFCSNSSGISSCSVICHILASFGPSPLHMNEISWTQDL